ncbi:TetR/AcrR family transcriptional regulator [Haloechinothrix salitolerans]|uniref:TetR/AcrR family transcriptional regulator n=1 Tax=Haloechinothrix salitolerans TaxID=926830 RepID=A0ABW2C5Y3_9PSEU
MRTATEHFLRNGYHRTSMVDIAATIGITSTALYRHFTNKEELLTRSVLDGLDEIIEGIAHTEGLDELIDSLAHGALAHRGMSALWQREFRYLSKDTQALVMRKLVGAAATAQAAIERARPELSHDDAEFLGWCLLAVFESVSHHQVMLPEEEFRALLRAVAHRVAATELPADATADEQDYAIDPVIPMPHEASGSSRRDRLIAAAALLFSERGYASVSIDDIGAAVGITGPSVYYHFRRKSDILADIIDRAAAATEHYTAAAIDDAKSPVDSLERMLRYYISFAFTHRDLVRVAVSELTHLPADVAAGHRTRQREGIMTWARALLAVRPDLDIDAARVVVQAAIMIINDVVRLPGLMWRPRLHEDLFAAGMAAQVTQRT